MRTEIGFLQELEEDLLEVAWRGTLPSGRRTGRRRPRGKWLIAAAASLALVASAGIGYLVAGPGGAAKRALHAPTGARPAPESGLMPAASPPDDLHTLYTGAPKEAGPARAAMEAPPLGDGARVVKTAEIALVVDRFGDGFAAAADVAADYGGFVQETSMRSEGRAGAVLMRVPADRFDDALDALRKIGKVESESIRGKDVTAEFIDLRARLKIAKVRRTVLFQLMEKANTIQTTLHVQNALDDVQLRIEETQGRLNLLSDQTQLATIRVQMREEGVAAEPVTNPSIRSAWDNSVAGFFRVIFAAIVGLGYLAPVAAVTLGVWFVVRRVRRRAA